MTTDGFGIVKEGYTNDPKLSVWTKEGFQLPGRMVSFREQIDGNRISMIVVWSVKPKPKAPDEVGTT